MNESLLHNDVILGCGGHSPGIRMIDRATGSSKAWLALPASTYAIDVNPVRGIAACGTRAGTIHLVGLASTNGHESPSEITHLLHGRPVLSVCFAGNDGLVSADDSGQVLYWRNAADSAPARWLSDAPLICSLNADAEPVVVGLGAGGQIILWDSRTGEAIAQLVGPPPLSPLGLARLAGWTPGEPILMVYPGQDGQLAVIRTDPPLVQVCRAHEGRWYAAFQIGRQLVTLGYDDGTAKFWRWSDDGPMCTDELVALHGVVDAECMSQTDRPRGLAVVGTGGAVAFTVMPEGLAAREVVPGEAHRIVAAPSEHLLRQAATLLANRRAEELRHQIAASIERGEESEIDDALLELDRLGHHTHSLELRIQRALRLNDDMARLQALHQLFLECTASDQPITSCVVQQYLDLLVCFGQFERAVDVLSRIDHTYPGVSEVLNVETLQRVAAAVRDGRVLIRPFIDAPEGIHQVIRAAQMLGSTPEGLWELHRSPSIVLPGVELHPEQLADALGSPTEDGSDPGTGAVARPVAWVQGGSCEEAVSVFLPVHLGCETEMVKIALRLAIRPAGTALTRSVLLNPAADGQGRRGERLLGLVGQLQDDSTRTSLLAPVNEKILTTLRRMRSLALASAMNPLGGVT